MKKARFLALALVVAVMMVGAGYAWWTDLTEIDTTVSTGELNVDVQWANITHPSYTGGTISGGINDADGDNKKIVVNISNLYPTKYKNNGDDARETFARIHFSVVNNGTVPVKLDSIEYNLINPESPAWELVKTVIHIHQGTPSSGKGLSLGNSRSLTGVNPIGSHTETNAKYLKDLDALLMNSELATTVLYPGEAIWFGGNTEDESSIRFWLDRSAGEDTENQDIGFELKFNWAQFNKVD